MYPVIILNIFSFLGLNYYFIKLYRIKYYYSFDIHRINWYPSLGAEGYKLTFLLRNINIIYAINITVSIWIYVIGHYYRNDLYTYYMGLSILSILVVRIFMTFFGKIVLYQPENENVPIQNIESGLNLKRWEYRILKDKKDYFNFRCCICLEEKVFNCRSNILPCNHDVFCKTCIQKLCENNDFDRCPICRANFNIIQIFIRNN